MSKSIDFEKSLDELEKTEQTKLYKNIELPLARVLYESVKLFEKGIKLSDDCRKMLQNARQKIVTLTEAEKEANDDEAD